MTPTTRLPSLAHAVALHEAGQTEAAAAAYEQLLAADPRQPSLRHNLGLIRLHQQATARALPLLEQAWAEDGAHDGWLQTLPVIGTVLHGMGLWEDARRWLARAAARAPAGSMLAPALGDVLRRIQPRDYLAPEVFDPLQARTLLRFSPRESDTYVYVIDVVGAAYPGGATGPARTASDADPLGGHMPNDLFERILDKIVADAVADRPVVWLGNWGEPLHHPTLGALIQAVKQRGLSCHLKTQLSGDERLRELADANPDDVTVSWAPPAPLPPRPPLALPCAAAPHPPTDLARVIANMRRLRQCLDLAQATTRVCVDQPLYRVGEAAVAALTALCGELRFAHRPITVIARPLERLADLLDGRGATDPQWLALAEPPQAYLPRIAATRSKRHDCEWRFNQTVINPDGTVVLCRGVVDTSNRTGLRFIGTPHAELEAARYRHPFCTTCMQHGLSCSVPDASKIG